LKKSTIKRSLFLSALALPWMAMPATAQVLTSQTAAGTDRPLKLAPNSPFRDPDIIYLEADELINNEDEQYILAKGEVEGRYQDRTLRAEEVKYFLDTGIVIASGNVTLIDSNGSVQYAETLELSNELEAGTAKDFTARTADGGIMAAAFATRTGDGEIELYNAYYTACEPCKKDGKVKKPTWRIKARKVRQDADTRTIRYNDAVFEFFGLPLFWTPYLSHPDPSADRASGLLTPFVGLSSSKGFNATLPYYWAIDDYTEATIRPHFFQKVNPIMEYQFRRKFHTGEINVEGSFTNASFFDRDGDPYTVEDLPLFDAASQDLVPLGKRWRSHIYASGLFAPNETWTYGFGVQLSTDDNYLNRYDQDETPERFGLYDGESRRNISQAFIIGQDDTFRFSTSAFGFQDLRTSFRENANTGLIRIIEPNDRELPIIAPKIEIEKYFNLPGSGGRIKTFGDATILNRNIGTDYTRFTAGVDYSNTFIAPMGVELKPFANARFDSFEFEPESLDKVKFDRTIGQVGIDVRYPFMKTTPGANFIIEPRVQLTQNFGKGKLDSFTVDANGAALPGCDLSNNGGLPNLSGCLFQDGIDVDIDQALFWESNKATGLDFWQEGFRADVGASFIADFGESRANLFIGQSYADTKAPTILLDPMDPNSGAQLDDRIILGSGLDGDKSDIVGMFELDLNNEFKWSTRIRYDDDDNAFRRIDTGFNYTTDRFSSSWRYYRLDSATRNFLADPDAPAESLIGNASVKLTDNWSVKYSAYRDLDDDITRSQALSLLWEDGCTLVEFRYNRNNYDNEVLRDSQGFGIRVSLLTLGELEPE